MLSMTSIVNNSGNVQSTPCVVPTNGKTQNVETSQYSIL